MENERKPGRPCKSRANLGRREANTQRTQNDTREIKRNGVIAESACWRLRDEACRGGRTTTWNCSRAKAVRADKRLVDKEEKKKRKEKEKGKKKVAKDPQGPKGTKRVRKESDCGEMLVVCAR